MLNPALREGNENGDHEGMKSHPVFVYGLGVALAAVLATSVFFVFGKTGRAPAGTGGAVEISASDLRDSPGLHGMLLFGEGPFYLSHLPMYHSPHDYQAIFEVDIDEASRQAYLASKRSGSVVYHTIAPEIFVLPRFAAEGFPFRAKIYQDHFERGGRVLSPEAVFRLRRTLVFKKLRPETPKTAEGRFWVIGSGNDLYLVHRIGGRPDFDQILAVKPSRPLGGGEVVFAAQGPLMGDVSGVLEGSREPVSFRVRGIYLETGDLEH